MQTLEKGKLLNQPPSQLRLLPITRPRPVHARRRGPAAGLLRLALGQQRRCICSQARRWIVVRDGKVHVYTRRTKWIPGFSLPVDSRTTPAGGGHQKGYSEAGRLRPPPDVLPDASDGDDDATREDG